MRRRILVAVFFSFIAALLSLFGLLTIPDIVREGADFVGRLQSDNIWVVLVQKMREGLGRVGAAARPPAPVLLLPSCPSLAARSPDALRARPGGKRVFCGLFFPPGTRAAAAERSPPSALLPPPPSSRPKPLNLTEPARRDQIMESLERFVRLATSSDLASALSPAAGGREWTIERSTQLGLAVSKLLKGYTTTAAAVTAGMLSSVTKFALQARARGLWAGSCCCGGGGLWGRAGGRGRGEGGSGAASFEAQRRRMAAPAHSS